MLWHTHTVAHTVHSGTKTTSMCADLWPASSLIFIFPSIYFLLLNFNFACPFFHNSCPTVHTVQCFDILYAVWHANCLCGWNDSGLRLLSLCPTVFLASSSAPASSLCLCLCPFSASCSFPVQCTNTQAGKRHRLWQREGCKGGHRQRLQLNARCQRGEKDDEDEDEAGNVFSYSTATIRGGGGRGRGRDGHRGSFC